MDESQGPHYQKGLSEDKWKLLVKHIRRGKCTPFIGAGACCTLPKGSELALDWARENDYPLEDKKDLQRVSQFIAITQDAASLKDDLVEILRSKPYPDFAAENEPHALLADLELPVYITTNYDDFMLQALRKRERKVRVDFARWANEVNRVRIKSVLFDEEYEPTAQEPVVFHLHGNCEHPASMVLTEEDYVDYLINLSKNADMLPPIINESLASSSLMFIGYSLNDWTLRFILRGLMSTMTTKNRYRSIAVQLEPTAKSDQEQLAACEYLDKYFDAHFNLEIDVYWGKAEDFVVELRKYWELYR